ncbi:MAG: type II toxin-antitoxin system RelE/ParE family toxin [Leptospiraceae bacterium]|uniref:type II toxin-antitoxin system RelE/ParE family toxin n=1 Tax=Flavobacterium sp. TaxID=239 RepID=UPI0025BD1122|nr:type II toxin-antitoxin system RelE/ParE family toxin [Flavobacterium sp.]MBE7411563.1 type II toxin-antitoxin system RelE/ParE family toxin [Leptospiraceae bacterium]MCK6382656.1 type II toxin-antitoxin system RelE/ParE family toxin [Leptospiraceae bacterium]MCK6609317.1 type II toxin-antitoxin system RelE/ParE family toxin [Flavobacterium sp.]
MIKSFHDKDTEKIWKGEFSKRIPNQISDVALRKLRLINGALELENLRIPPKNFLEALRNDRKGQHSIRINDQWRICFTWIDGHAFDVEIVDYH